MTPTEHEATVALDAAARAAWDAARKIYAENRTPNDTFEPPAWDDLDPLEQLHRREFLLPTVWAALQALPDRFLGTPAAYNSDDATGTGPADGHLFRIAVNSRGSYSVEGDPAPTDSDWDTAGAPWYIEVRAWNLHDALVKATALPLHAWVEPTK